MSACFSPPASSGTVTINSDGTVQILVEEAAPLDNFDLQVCLIPVKWPMLELFSENV